ncbi:hypothetical protein KUCAC02_009239 [Chaenocephalus aceratus]|uniref:Uncharacterized protein n=1 Tax=Chaenocephalus aceratus TaxID=36190 RepID=A0ACB9WTK2_CHAAC|nr:hypothetical protein KUCAC02_009239 [Chaenocephalus aceratus]
MEGPLQTPQPPRTCGSPGGSGRSCWSLDARIAVLLVTLAGALILLLLYKLLQLRHRLSMARARHALEYHSFYHSATYTLKHAASCQELPDINGTAPADADIYSRIGAFRPSRLSSSPTIQKSSYFEHSSV